MPYYHVTYDRHVPSILKHGLGGAFVERNWPEAKEGVYLADDFAWGLTMLIERMMETADDSVNPKDWIESIRIIVIDDSRLDRARLGEDESFPGHASIWRYLGTIDVTNMPILTVDQATPPEFRPGGAEYERLKAQLGE